jgi:hypothetical protein
MPKIAIIKNTGNTAMDQIFREVYGAASVEVVDNDGVARQNMRVAPEFNAISSVFAGTAGRDFPVQAGGILELELPTDAMASIVKDQLMLSLKERWSRMYEQRVAAMPDGIASMALRSEAATASAAIEVHFASRGVRAWAVPIKGVMKVYTDGAYVQNEQQLLETINPSLASDIALLGGDHNVVLASEVAASQAGAPAMAQGATAEEAQQPTWAEYDGIEVDVEGHTIVMAPNPEAARAATIVMLDLVAANPTSMGMSMVATKIVATREIRSEHPAEAGADSSNDDLDDDDDSNLDRDYTFQRG